MAEQGVNADPGARNVEVVRSTYEALGHGDIDGLLAVCHPDVRVLDEENQVGATGREQYRRWITQYLESWESYREYPEEFVPTGDAVVVCVRSEGRGAGSGVQIVEHHGEIHTVRDGRIAKIMIYPTFSAAKKAAGVDA